MKRNRPPAMPVKTYMGAGDTAPHVHSTGGTDAMRGGVLVYPRRLDIHRVDVVDASGRPIPTEP